MIKKTRLFCLTASLFLFTSCHALTESGQQQPGSTETQQPSATQDAQPNPDETAAKSGDGVKAENDETGKANNDADNDAAKADDGTVEENKESDTAENKEQANLPDSNQRVIKISEPGTKPFIKEGQVKASKHIKLKVTHKKSSDWLDSGLWLSENNFTRPELNRTEDGYTFTGLLDKSEYSYDFRLMKVKEPSGRETIFDFTEFGTGGGWQPFIQYAMIKDNILYVSLAHNTYADTNPDTAFILALDLDGNVLWRSKTLVCNANNFLIIDETIICGYGFTNEPDFVYTLDLHTGEVLDKIGIKSGPDFIIKQDNVIRMSTYNTDYTFSIK